MLCKNKQKSLLKIYLRKGISFFDEDQLKVFK